MIPIKSKKWNNRTPCFRCGVMRGYGRKIIQITKLWVCDYCAPIMIDQIAQKLMEIEKDESEM